MNAILKGVRPLDYVLAGLMTLLGAFLMVENIASGDDASLAHPVSTHSWLMLPAFVLVTLPILWRRRNILAVIGVTIAASVVHLLAFDWLTRCGATLPLSFALAYAVARFAGSMRNQVIGLAGVVLLQVVVLFHDSSIGPMADGLVIALPGAALFYGIGLLVQNRVTRKQQSAAVAPAAEHATV
jgi:drug/metabolite transporter superfamily protein YnfA